MTAQKMISRKDRRAWLWANIPEHGVDILNSEFVDQYIEATGAKFRVQIIGANTCRQLGKDLSELHKEGYLKRGTIGLAGVGCGFAKWVYTYQKRPGAEP